MYSVHKHLYRKRAGTNAATFLFYIKIDNLKGNYAKEYVVVINFELNLKYKHDKKATY